MIVAPCGLDLAGILEQRHKGKPVYVDWIDHPELKALVTKLIILPDDVATKQLDAALGHGVASSETINGVEATETA